MYDENRTQNQVSKMSQEALLECEASDFPKIFSSAISGKLYNSPFIINFYCVIGQCLVGQQPKILRVYET